MRGALQPKRKRIAVRTMRADEGVVGEEFDEVNRLIEIAVVGTEDFGIVGRDVE